MTARQDATIKRLKTRNAALSRALKNTRDLLFQARQAAVDLNCQNESLRRQGLDQNIVGLLRENDRLRNQIESRDRRDRKREELILRLQLLTLELHNEAADIRASREIIGEVDGDLSTK